MSSPTYVHDFAPSVGAGCQCKVPGLMLWEILEDAYSTAGACVNPMDSAEDSALLSSLPPELLVSCDLATLIDTDATRAGRIAALHSFSDIYASGGIPKWALSIAIFPAGTSQESAGRLLGGMMAAAREDGVAIVGGQTIYGGEAMAGMVSLGALRSTQPLRKQGASPGMSLYLSKPVGTGMVVQAKNLKLAGKEMIDQAFTVMECSNARAGAAAVQAAVASATDVTGFGLLGHLCQLLNNGAGAELTLTDIPTISGLYSLPETLSHAPWLTANMDYAQSLRTISTALSHKMIAPLLDPQTNGGLLAAANPHCKILIDAGYTEIGKVIPGNTIIIQ